MTAQCGRARVSVWRVWVLLVLMALVGPVLAAEGAPLRFGILPFNSTLALMKTHQPLRQFLQARLGRPVEIFTAPDYQSFLREQLDGNYDLMITPPHFGLMAIDKGYVPLYHYKARMEPIMVVRKDDTAVDARGLRGRRIAIANRIAFASMAGLKWLGEKGMRPERDFVLQERPTHGAAIAAVAVGDADGAITTTTLLGQVPEDVRQRLRYFSSEIRLPHVLFMAHKRLGAAEQQRIKDALRAFESAPEGQAFFKETSYIGFEELDARELAAYKPYLATLRQLLEQSRPQ